MTDNPTGLVRKSLMRLSWPLLVVTVLTLLAALGNVIVLSIASPELNAAVATANQMLGVVYDVSVLFSIGALVVVAQQLGAGKERDAALRNLEAAAAQLDAMREAWHISQAQLAREREVAHAAMKRALELHREIMRGSAAVRYGLSPAQWVEALGIAKSERPDLWREEEES